MSDTTTPKPGSTLTAAQANALPAGSEIAGTGRERLSKQQNGKWTCSCHGWEFDAEDDKYTLVRVGPAAFAVGDVVTREQLDALPVGVVVLPEQCKDDPDHIYTKVSGGWNNWSGELRYDRSRYFQSATFRIISLPSTNPHAPGTLDWAHWAARYEEKCVRAARSSTWAFRDGRYRCWSDSSNHWHEGHAEPAGDFKAVLTGWSIVPDPSAAEPPVETSDETPVLHIDPAAIAAELDQAIPQWREEGFTVAQTIRVLRQRYEMQMQVCMYQGDSAAANGKHVQRLEEQVATLTAERDAAIREIGKSCYSMSYKHAEEIKGIKAERDAALQRAEKAEAERADYLMRFVQADQTASSLQMTCDHFQATIDETLAAAKVVVPDNIMKIVEWAIKGFAKDSDVGRLAAFVASLSLADHIVDANKMVQSTHQEGSREWAEDAMRQGFSVTHQYADDVCWKDFACTDGRKWKGRGMAGTGWRIHTPAVAPSAEPSVVKELKATPEQLAAAIQRAESNMQNAAKWVDPKATLPSVAQMQASIEAHEKRILALEGKG